MRVAGPAGQANVHTALVDAGGRVWTGQETGLRVYDADGRGIAVPEADRFGDAVVRVLFQRADGRLLAGGRSERGLHEWDGVSVRHYTTAHGLRDNVSPPLRADVPLLSESLRAHGFRTGAFVSSIVLSAQSGLARGFDTYADRFEAGDDDARFLNSIQKRGDVT